MVTTIFGILALCVIVTIISKVIGHYNREHSLFISLAAVCIIGIFIFHELSPVATLLTEIFSLASLDLMYVSILFKALGICYVTQLACDVCRDGGETALSTIAELSGKLSLVLVCVPLFEMIITLIGELIGL